MPILTIVIFVLVLAIIVVFVAYFGGAFQTATLDQSSIQQANESYNIPSAWSTAQPVQESTCLTYTFVSTGLNIPQPSVERLNAGSLEVQPINATCVDDDQVLAQHVWHTCKYGEFQDLPISQFNGCPLVNGEFTKINGYYEEFFTPCGNPANSSTGTGTGVSTGSTVTSANSTRCNGTIGLILWNYQSSLAGSFCMRDPPYTIDGQNIIVDPKAPLTIDLVNGCSISATQNNFPTQLFRVVRSTYTGTGFTIDPNGIFANIVHRPSSKYVAPYTLNAADTPFVTSLIPAFAPILIPSNSFNGQGNWWYLTSYMLMPQSLIRGVRPDPDPMLPSTIVGGPDWDGLYWQDQQRAANPQIVWTPNPSPVYNLTGADLWNYFTSTTTVQYSMVPFTIVNETADFSQMSLVPFLTYQIITPFPSVNAIPPITDPTCPYYPTSDGLIDYATENATNPNSGCYGYDPVTNSFIIPTPGNPGTFTVQPIMWNDACNQQYVNMLTEEYNAAISEAQERVISEQGSFQYVNLTLIPDIFSQVSSFFGTP